MTEHGLFNAFVYPGSLVQLADAMDPSGGCVVIEWHGVLPSQWTSAVVPLQQEELLSPLQRKVRNLEFDVAVDLAEFRSLMASWNGPVYAWQCDSAEPPKVSIGREKRGTGTGLVEAMRDLGIELLIESGGQHDATMLASHSEAALTAALARFGPSS